MVATKNIWLRIGDSGDYAQFDDIDDALSHLNKLCVGKIESWLSNGFTTVNYWGADYISCYWGDDDAQLESYLLPDERTYIEDGLVESYL